MKLVFLHSGEKVKMDEYGDIYVDGSYPKEIINFYQSLCKEITFVFRKDLRKYKKKDIEDKYLKLDKKKIKFIECIDYNKSIKDYISIINRIKNHKIIKSAVMEADIVIARVPSEAGYLGIKYSKKHKKKCIVEVVGCAYDTLINLDIRGKIIAIPKFLKEKKYVSMAENVVYVSNEFLQNRYPNGNNILACSDVILDKIDKNVLNRRINKILNMKYEKKISLCTIAAVNVKYKGQKYVIKAISRLIKEGYDIKYYLIGGGSNEILMKYIKKYNLKDNIIFLGTLKHEKIFGQLDAIDVYIQPSNQEGLSRAVIEAMSRACPVIVSTAGGNTELIRNKKFIFKKKKVNQIVNCIKNMSKENMLIEANNNFDSAQDYIRSKLKMKRTKFYKNIIDS